MRLMSIDRKPAAATKSPYRHFGWCAILALLCARSPAATVDVFGVVFDPANGTTQVSIESGGYTTPYGLALYSGGSDDWVPESTMGQSLGTYVQVPDFQAEYDPNNPRLGNTGSSITLGADPGIAGLSNPRDVIFTRWADGYGLVNEADKDLAIFEKGTSEAYAIRVHNASTETWSPWYFEIFEQTTATQFTTATLYDLSDLGVGLGEVINGIQITNLTAADTVATSTLEFDAGVELGYGEVIFGGGSGFAPARRRSIPDNELKQYEAGKFDPDIQFVVGLHDIADLASLAIGDVVTPASAVVVPIPTAVYLMLPALGLLFATGRTGRLRAIANREKHGAV